MDQLDVRFLYASAMAGMAAGTCAAMASISSLMEQQSRWKAEMWLQEMRAERQRQEIEFQLSLQKLQFSAELSQSVK